MKSQKEVDDMAVKGKKAVANDTYGGRHALTLNPQKPDQKHVEGTERPALKGIRYVS